MLKEIRLALTRLFQAVGYFIYLIFYSLESIFIIYPIEAVMRLWHALDPRVYIQSLRIRNVVDGNVGRKNDTFFIFVLFTKSSLPLFTSNALAAIEQSPHNLIIVSNAPLPPLLKAQLADRCHKIIERHNVGRDFGAYKDGVNYVLEHYPDAGRIVLMNDSVFFLQKSLDKLIAGIAGPYQFIGVTEVHQFHYHVQSFMLSFGREVLRSRIFLRFWKKYLPINTRRWTIHRGEVRLTRTLTKGGFRPHILYQAAHLVPHLERRTAREVIESIRLLPITVRDHLYSAFVASFDDDTSSSSLSALEAISHGIRRIHPGAARGDGGQLSRINSQAAHMEQWSFGIFPHQIVSSISQNNQMHHGAFLFIKHLGLPILKRDIFFRELYTLEDVYQFLSDIGEPLRDDILADLRRSGSGVHLRGLWRIMYRHGSL